MNEPKTTAELMLENAKLKNALLQSYDALAVAEKALRKPQRCEECNKKLSDEERNQRLCELCSAGVPCETGESERKA